jgi:hypothetical protein
MWKTALASLLVLLAACDRSQSPSAHATHPSALAEDHPPLSTIAATSATAALSATAAPSYPAAATAAPAIARPVSATTNAASVSATSRPVASAVAGNTGAKPAARTVYVCPMHPEVLSNEPGTCPKCNMNLEAKPALAAPGAAPEEHGGHDHAGHAP